MMGSPVSGMSLKSKYFISDKEKGSFKIEDAENIRKRGGRLYVKSCEDRNIK